MARKKQDVSQSLTDMELVDGYYMPKKIVAVYQGLKSCCISEISKVLECAGYQSKVIEEDAVLYLYVYQNQVSIYRVELSPQHVSQLEKVIGTNKLFDCLEAIKETKNG